MELLDNNLIEKENPNVDSKAFAKLALWGAFLYGIIIGIVMLVLTNLFYLTSLLKLLLIVTLTAFVFFVLFSIHFVPTLKSKTLPSILAGGIWTTGPVFFLMVILVTSTPDDSTYFAYALFFPILGFIVGGIMALYYKGKNKAKTT